MKLDKPLKQLEKMRQGVWLKQLGVTSHGAGSLPCVRWKMVGTQCRHATCKYFCMLWWLLCYWGPIWWRQRRSSQMWDRQRKRDLGCGGAEGASPSLQSEKSKFPSNRKHRRVQNPTDIANKIPGKMGMLVYLPVPSRRLMSLQEEGVSSPCSFATAFLTASILHFRHHVTSRPVKWRTLVQLPSRLLSAKFGFTPAKKWP